MRDVRLLLGIEGFGTLLGAQSILWLGASSSSIALVFAMLDSRHGASGAGLLLAARTLPVITLGLMGGVLADRVKKRTVVVACSALGGIAQLFVLAVVSGTPGSLVLLTLAVLALGAMTATAAPSFYALPVDFVPTSQLQEAQATLRIVRNATSIVGPVVGGAVVATAGPQWLIGADAVGMFVAAALLTRLPRGESTTAQTGMTRELRDGWREFVSRRWLTVSVLAFGLALVGWSAGYGVLGPLVVSAWPSGAGAWGLIAGSLAGGYVIGSLLALRWHPNRPVVHALVAQSATATFLVGLFTGLPLSALLPLAVLTGVAMDQAGVVWAAAMQRHVPAAVLGKVSSYDYVATFGLVPVGYVAAGPLVSSVGLHAALGACIALVLVPPVVASLTPAARSVVNTTTENSVTTTA